jgi:hypothetical protein
MAFLFILSKAQGFLQKKKKTSKFKLQQIITPQLYNTIAAL